MLADFFGTVPSIWYNELRSRMTITSIDYTTGSFSGTYNSAVGTVHHEYVLFGRFDTRGDTLGWVVSWQNSFNNHHSTTAWSGHREVVLSKPTILTTWLLTSSTTSEKEWLSTNTGFDTFTLHPPTDKQVLLAQSRRQSNHPKLWFENE